MSFVNFPSSPRVPCPNSLVPLLLRSSISLSRSSSVSDFHGHAVPQSPCLRLSVPLPLRLFVPLCLFPLSPSLLVLLSLRPFASASPTVPLSLFLPTSRVSFPLYFFAPVSVPPYFRYCPDPPVLIVHESPCCRVLNTPCSICLRCLLPCASTFSPPPFSLWAQSSVS